MTDENKQGEPVRRRAWAGGELGLSDDDDDDDDRDDHNEQDMGEGHGIHLQTLIGDKSKRHCLW